MLYIKGTTAVDTALHLHLSTVYNRLHQQKLLHCKKIFLV